MSRLNIILKYFLLVVALHLLENQFFLMFSESEEIFPSNFVETTRVMAVAVAASEKFVPSNLVIITKVMVVSEIIVISTDLRFEELRYWVIE